MKGKLIVHFLFIFCFAHFTYAQSSKITGTVTSSDDNLPLLGATVLVKGTSVGTTTDFDGNYVVEAPLNSTLVFSYVGYQTKEVKVTSIAPLNVSLQAGDELDEVIITALGIKREKKALGYAVQAVESDALMEGNQNNMVNGLQGKVSGVTVVNSGGAPGSSAVILIRGGSSITGSNQPLFVVDGIPIDNSTSSSLEVASTNRASDINPADIESVSVLKGPAAAALYGIQAAGGAVIITTKRGKAGVSTVSYSGSVSSDQVIGTPDVQTTFGKGAQIRTQDGITYDPESPFSFGQTLNSGTPIFNNIEDFYQAATTQNHNVSYSSGSEKSNIYMSIGDLSQNGVIEGTSYDKTSFKINANSNVSDNFTVGISANYITTDILSSKQGNAAGSSFGSLLAYPGDVNAKEYLNADGSQKTFFLDQQFDNPYWSTNNSPNSDETKRLIGIISFNYNFLNDFNLSYKIGTDNYTQFNKKITGNGSLIDTREDGYISQFEKDHSRLTSNIFLSYQKDITEDLSFDGMIGNSVEELDIRTTFTSGTSFLAPGIYSVGNILKENQLISELITRKRIVGVFGEFKFGWKNALFLNLTGRNDWSSTLPKDKRSFFYPSVGMSAVVSDLFKVYGNDITSDKGLSYFKLRATWAQVGKDAPIGALESSLGTNINGLASSAYTWNGVNVGNPNLEPEFTNSFEIGTDIRFFQNRLGFDFTYYTSTSDNQILRDIRVPPTTGTFYATLNGGSIKNSGVEAMLRLQMLPQTSKVSWNLDFNFGANKSEVKELPGFLNEVYLSDSWTFRNSAAGAAILDGSLFGLRGKRPVKNENGDVIINSNGLPTLTDQTYTDVNRTPDWTLGISNSVGYKNLNLSFLLDIVQGGEVYNATESALAYYGLSTNTVADRNQSVVLPGVDATGNPNTVAVSKDQNYYQNYYSQNSENFIEDGSFARLRYVTLSYKFPEATLEKLSLSGLEIYATGRNLFTITDYSGVDPEVNTFGAGISGAGSMNIDNLGTPNVKGFDLGLRFRF
ncbi:SusC/RagA family TonB-linked outer membrane protein [Gelidibacter salicanalis]|uniref:SusC/RagA family TonB-linked outer membrane protein n=1 Tax=Gelidibacter salicanalis TaxID=291193 RepID=A0A5C7AS89_9FLAO|nr:SusC/RagA family TonB-linked outer membrane protein [Gelidibacter salicanalis]TXE10433.1 SusC/RagA family TonB-linked outer membrane protein [Gelidibacter salicanalis]